MVQWPNIWCSQPDCRVDNPSKDSGGEKAYLESVRSEVFYDVTCVAKSVSIPQLTILITSIFLMRKQSSPRLHGAVRSPTLYEMFAELRHPART